MKLENFINRVNELLQMGEMVLATTQYDENDFTTVNNKEFSTFRSAVLSFLLNLFGSDHPYYSEFNDCVKIANPYHVERGIGILRAIYGELSGGWIWSAKSLVSAEVFSDFLEMALYLLDERYKDAAAVIIGSVLEEHLRHLCQKASIDINITKEGIVVPKKADALNSDLSNHDVYNKLDQKSVTAWLDLRNKAAHGKYDEYSKDQVSLMYQGVVELMTRVPS